jgi:hypothetical protein
MLCLSNTHQLTDIKALHGTTQRGQSGTAQVGSVAAALSR